MCLRPITINNPTKRISRTGGQQLKLSVPCGSCAECMLRKQTDLSFRTFHHAKDVIFRQGGYMYFVTLTYAPEHLPMLSHFVDIDKYGLVDFSCFNHDHYKLFFKRLRTTLERKYNSKGDISYFFTTEYGMDDRYTHRPHLHVMLFNKNRNIHPIDLQNVVSDCWDYGLTDGLENPDTTFEKFAYHVYGYDLGYGNNTETYVLRAVTHYVSKYITKVSTFKKELDKRINALQDSLMDEEEIKALIKRINMFSRQSQGYGLGYLNELYNSDDSERLLECLKTNQSILPDKEKGIKTVTLPMYYIRKLFYETVTSSTGKKCWQLTEKGLQHKKETEIYKLNKRIQNIKDDLLNATPQQRTYFESLMNGRDIYDYAIYMQYYYGRLRGYSGQDYKLFNVSDYTPLRDNETIDNIEWHNTLDKSYYSNTLSLDSVFCVDDNNYIDLSSDYESILQPFFKVPCKVKWLHKREFIDYFTFNSKCDERFKNFDLVTSLLTHIKDYRNRHRQATYDYMISQKDKMKDLYSIKQ